MENKKDGETAVNPEVVKKRKRPLLAWVFLIFAIIYTISPVDLIPDAIPVVGWFDDALINLAAILNLIIRYRKLKK
ncbi:MAG: YkvA family protein [Endomicrobia bacterium]|nr:YkvA family protein [Endomicrobiia bacterium]